VKRAAFLLTVSQEYLRRRPESPCSAEELLAGQMLELILFISGSAFEKVPSVSLFLQEQRALKETQSPPLAVHSAK